MNARHAALAVAAVALVALGAVVPSGAHAQSQEQVRVSVAVIATPTGGFPSIVTAPDRSHLGVGLVADYGVVSRLGVNRYGYGVSGTTFQSSVYGASVEVPLGGFARVAGTVGEVSPRCSSQVIELCLRVRSAGGRAQGWVLRRGFGARRLDGSAPYIAGVGLEVSGGAGHSEGVSLTSYGVGVPLAIAFNVRAPDWSSETDPHLRPRTVLFLTPGLARGEWNGAGLSSSGTFSSLTAGVSVLDIGPGFGVTANARRLAVPNSDLQVAFGLSWHRR